MAELRLLIVDDSAMYRQALKGIVETIPGVECVGVACNGKEAMEKIVSKQPDVVTLDMEMPVMGGMEVIKSVTAKNLKTKLIVVSACSQSGAEIAISALEQGAYDFITKPNRLGGGGAQEDIRRQLMEKLEALKLGLKTSVRHDMGSGGTSKSLRDLPVLKKESTVLTPVLKDTIKVMPVPRMSLQPKAIAMGCSTGGPKALLKLFAGFQSKLNVPIFIVQHMPPMFTKTLAKSIDEVCALSVKEAEDGEKPLPNHVYIAPGGRQMKLINGSAGIEIKITDEEPGNFCKPSVDYFFSSVADIYEGSSLGVILSGMGSDGCEGLRKMKRKGVAVLGQDEKSCVVYGMPRVAQEAGLVDQQVDIEQMAMTIERVMRLPLRATRQYESINNEAK